MLKANPLRFVLPALLFSSTAVFPLTAYATNGVFLEGYGPESTAMAGAASSFDNGTAGMVNNPATLSLMADGESRLDAGLGNLRPSVSATITTPQGKMEAESGGNSYFTPAIGWVKKKDGVSYGLGMYSLGGMGTEYSRDTFLGAGDAKRGPIGIGVGSLVLPVSYEINDNLSVGMSMAYLWGGLDLQMWMPMMNPSPTAPGGIAPTPGSFADFSPAFGGSQVMGSASGPLLNSMAPMIGSMTPAQMTGTSAAFDFSDNGDFTTQTSGDGLGASLGFTYQMTPTVVIGASYHAKTGLRDFKGEGALKLIDIASGSTLPNGNIPGEYRIKDFQLPERATLGAAWNISDKTMIAVDFSHVNWSASLKNFELSFTASDLVPGMGGQSLDVVMKQNWKDQNILKLGVAHKLNPGLTIRGGLSLANNPVPDELLNPVFPATVTSHLTAGFSYSLSEKNMISGSLVYVPEVSQRNVNTGIEVSHSQTNLQLMYSHWF